MQTLKAFLHTIWMFNIHDVVFGDCFWWKRYSRSLLCAQKQHPDILIPKPSDLASSLSIFSTITVWDKAWALGKVSGLKASIRENKILQLQDDSLVKHQCKL